MASVSRPFSQISFNFEGLSASSPFPSPQKRPAVRGHYRPYSTLYLEKEKPSRNSVLSKSRRQSVLHRSVSLSDAMGLGKKKTGEKDKDKAATLRIRKLSDISASTPPPTTKAGMSRPQKLALSDKGGALHRVKAQRSIGSLFTTATSVSPNSAALEHKPLSHPHSFLPPPRSRKMEARPTQSRRSSKVDVDDDVNRKKPGTFVENNIWYTRSRTKVHPYTKEVPYMQSYDATCLDNDRYSELLLERLNPGSPSFWDYGKKPPLTVLDLGCGQGHWVLYAASLWKNSRITGFDLMDITLPAFQTTENVNFIRGNFLIKLPFPSKSFEYVRMANLSLCVPYDHWLPLLTEVRRVLTNGGRLELIDDQIMFPYGEEPQLKDPIIKHTKTESPQSSFFGFSHDDDSSDGDDDTLEYETSASTTSTLVSERASRDFFDKLPSSKRSSAQSNASTTVGSETHASDLPLPLTISIPPCTLPLEATISPSPTVTQATFNALDSDHGTITHSPTITDHKRHRKTGSASSTRSTRSQSEALSFWRSRKQASTEMEVIFEHVLVHKYGIHPRPSEFVVDTMRRIFGKGNAGKVRSYHIKLAPFDSPIGPGGSLAPTIDEASRKSDNPKKQWKNKEKKRDRRKLEKPDSPRSSFDESPTALQPPVVTAKAASRLGLVPTVPSLPPRRVSSELSSGSESSDSSDPVYNSQLPVVSAKAASRLGIPVNPPPVPPKSDQIRKSYINTRSQSAKEVPRASGVIRLGAPQEPHHVPGEESAPSPISITPTISHAGYDQVEQQRGSPSLIGTVDSSESEQSCSSSSSGSDPSSDVGGVAGGAVQQPPVLSAKAAGRLGISYSVLAAASAAHSRGSGVMVPVQSPGLLVWPSTYIPMSPGELEMHSCKWVQTLLGCRHALREHITGEFEGRQLVNDAEFEEAFWDYECFRRSRFHWPLDNPDLFDEDGFPESPTATAPTQGSPIREQRPVHSRHDSCESFNGQYRRDDLTHVRTIRVFEAVKAVDEKSFVAMLFPSQPTRSN